MKLIENTSLVLLTAVLLGLIIPNLSIQLKPLLTFLLIALMTLSLRHIKMKQLNLRKNSRKILTSVAIHYGLLSMTIIALALFLVDDPDYFKGLIVMAVMPPGVVVVAYSYLLKGDINNALSSEVVCYLLSFIIAPVVILLFFGASVDVYYLLQILFLLIVLPIILSRFLMFKSRIFDYDKIIINICVGIIIYTVVGLNQTTILTKTITLFSIFLIGFVKTYGTGSVVYLGLKKFGVPKKERVVYALFGSLKNLAATATVSIMLFGEKAALPASIIIIFEATILVLISFLMKRE